MKKTYNVYSRNHALKFLSVMVFLTFFFLGNSVFAQAPQAMERQSDAITHADFITDYSLSGEAQIGVTPEQALEILEQAMADFKIEAQGLPNTFVGEAVGSLKGDFLKKTYIHITKGDDVVTSLFKSHSAIAHTAAEYESLNGRSPELTNVVNNIVRETAELLR